MGERGPETDEREGALANRPLNTNAVLKCLTILSTIYGNTIQSPSLVGEPEVESLAPVVLCSGEVCGREESQFSRLPSMRSNLRAKAVRDSHSRLPSVERAFHFFAFCALRHL